MSADPYALVDYDPSELPPRPPIFEDDAAAGSSEATQASFQLLDVDALAELPEPQWLINGCIHEGGFSVVYGAPASGKTFWALDAGLAVASGSTSSGGPVIYSAGEGLLGLSKRVASWQQAFPDHDPRTHGFHVVPHTVPILDAAAQRQLRATFEALDTPPKLLVLDTWARALAGLGDENSAQDISRAVAFLDTLRESYGTSVMVVHHASKHQGHERGSTALRAAADTMIQIEEDNGLRRVTNTKQKDAEHFPQYLMHLAAVGDSCVPQPAIAGSGNTSIAAEDQPF